MKVYLVCSIVVGRNRQKGISGDARYFFLHGITGSYLIFCSYNFYSYKDPPNMNVITATITKIITSHFAISIVKPAIPRMPMIKNTRASIRKITAR